MLTMIIRIFVLVLPFFVITQTQVQAQDSDFQYQKTEVKGAISVLHGAGGNIGVLQGDDGLLVIDDGFVFNSGQLESALAAYGDAPRYVLNTHWHGDHTGGNAALGEATIVAHENVRIRLAAGSTVPGREAEPAPQAALPDFTYKEGMSIHFAGQEISAVHFPVGHTDGDSVIFFEPAHVVHTGDLFFSGAFPFIDPDSGGSVAGYTANVAAIIALLDNDTVIIPGHGPVSTLDDLKGFQNMILETTAAVRAFKADGKSLEEAQAQGLSEEWVGWGDGFINHPRWISILWSGTD
ncbi:MAG: MBL fold metallo-hydrolase [Proteobacteria bacterium]|nr:MBL fold metallo-hydrolase [Pseudomonadota bacterium]